MSIRTATVILTHQTGVAEQLDAVITFARAYDVHLQVLTLGIGFDHLGLVQGAVSAAPLPMGLAEAVCHAEVLADHASAQLTREDIRWDVDPIATLSSGIGFDLQRNIRFSDLVVQVRPTGGQGDDASQIGHTVLFDADTPLLMLPTGFEIKEPASNILIAWDESQAALRAARSAIPFLKTSARVNVALVDPPKDAPDRSDPAGAFAQFLARHSIKCEISVMSSRADTIAETLRQRATEDGCDMIVMGAYGHSRLRQALFGGTTRSMLEEAPLPIFFDH